VQNKKRPRVRYAGASLGITGNAQATVYSDHSDGNGTRPFFALPDLVFHLLAFMEFLHGRPLHLGVVKEHFVPIPFDESETSIRNQLLDRTLWHSCPPTNKNLKRGRTGRLLTKQAIGPNSTSKNSHSMEAGTYGKGTATQNAA
jgi:hypothetical protein